MRQKVDDPLNPAVKTRWDGESGIGGDGDGRAKFVNIG